MEKTKLKIAVTSCGHKTPEYLSWISTAQNEHIEIECVELKYHEPHESFEVYSSLLQKNLQTIETADAIVFTGGLDVEPARFGRNDDKNVLKDLDVEIHPERDQMEWELAETALEKKLPILGICRGLQLINVVMGGTLYLDIQKEGATEISHKKISNDTSGFHGTKLLRQSGLFELIREESTDNLTTRHHQAIRDVAPELKAVAFSPDGIIEAAESKDPARDIWLVQWHPERMWIESAANPRLDNAFSKNLLLGFIDRLLQKKLLKLESAVNTHS
ncbi:MAG: gamma-glutamyl-gamma-aminobutyrate hydrolase family protein [Chloroherpetonaceae bacterium]|nr:gamma-glutamyl-gamma-aminobutyrate hydrolase family protein [Chloroherpetonaceae bacterium]